MFSTTSSLKALARRWVPHAVAAVALIWVYRNSLRVEIFDDEILTYFIPTLKTLADPSRLLPWKFVPADYWGHPPLQAALYALALFVVPAVETVRILSLAVSLGSLWTLHAIGRTLLGHVGAVVLMTLGAAHFIFWEIGNLMMCDGLLVLEFLLFFLGWTKGWRWRTLLAGIAMVLTRETSIIIIGSFWIKALLGARADFPRFLRMSALGICQVAWFAWLKWLTQSATPHYLHDGFFFDWDFVSATAAFIWSQTYWYSDWYLILALVTGLTCMHPKEAGPIWREHWPLVLVAVGNFVCLTTITSSMQRYQLFGLFAVAIFALLVVARVGNRDRFVLGFAMAVLLYLLGVNVKRGLWAKDHYAQASTRYQRVLHCAEVLHALPVAGNWAVGPFPFFPRAKFREALSTMRWQEPSTKPKDFVPLMEGASNYDYVMLARVDHLPSPQYDLVDRLVGAGKLLPRPDLSSIHCDVYGRIR